jgi:hypothetical protein
MDPLPRELLPGLPHVLINILVLPTPSMFEVPPQDWSVANISSRCAWYGIDCTVQGEIMNMYVVVWISTAVLTRMDQFSIGNSTLCRRFPFLVVPLRHSSCIFDDLLCISHIHDW